MGIVEPNDNRNSTPVHQEGENFIIEECDNNSLVQSPKKGTPKIYGKPKMYVKPKRGWDQISPKQRGGGVRRARRNENLNFLLNLGEKEEGEGIDIADLLEPSLSVFAELFMEQDKMNIWNDFVNRTEEDQENILKNLRRKIPSRGDNTQAAEILISNETNSQTSDDSWEVLGKDKRGVHPGYSSKESFYRIDKNLRHFLSRRQVPKGTLSVLEDEITDFFKEWPSSVYISKSPSSFDRLLLHAICQYLSLSSRSFDGDGGARQTQVENQYDTFYPPKQKLTQFLEERTES